MDFMREKKIIGIGTDIESIDRFKDIDDSFLNKIFTKNEIDYCFSKKNAAPHLAARYAGKEAVVKALNSMDEVNIDYKGIEILNNEKGVPVVKLNNKNIGDFQVKISLSHCEDKALAFVTITGE